MGSRRFSFLLCLIVGLRQELCFWRSLQLIPWLQNVRPLLSPAELVFCQSVLPGGKIFQASQALLHFVIIRGWYLRGLLPLTVKTGVAWGIR